MPLFSPPTIKRPVGTGPLFARYSYDKGVSVVLVDGEYLAIPYPETDVLIELEDGVDYFLGGHGPYQVSDELAAILAGSGFTVASDPIDPSPLPGDVAIVAATMPTQTTADVVWQAPTSGGSVVSYNVYRNDVLVNNTLYPGLTFHDSGLATATPNPTFTYYVRAVNSDGHEGGSTNSFQVQWNNSPIDPPPPPPPPDTSGYGEGFFGEGLYGGSASTAATGRFGEGVYGDGPYGG